MGRRPGPSLTRAEVVKVAVRVVRDDGADALKVSRVASELGIKPPSIYNHVGGGDALARAVVLEANRELVRVFKDAVREVFEPDQQLRALAEATRTWALANRGLYTLMARVEPDNDHPDFIPVHRDLMDLFGRPLGQLGLSGDAVVHAIRGVRAAVHGFVLLESAGQFQLEIEPEGSFRWLLDAVIAGIGGH